MKRNQLKEILAKTKAPPVLLFSNSDHRKMNAWWDRIRISPAYKPMINEIREEAERLLSEQEPPLTYSLFKQFSETGSRKEFEKVYFSIRRRLNTFAIMSLLEREEEKYRLELQNTIWSICNEYTWCLPAHLKERKEELNQTPLSLDHPRFDIDLFAAETAFALSEILNLTEEFIDPLIKKRGREEVYHRIFWPYKEGCFHWETAHHNWASVCAGSVGAAALYLMDDVEDLAAILERVLVSMNAYLKGFHEDGVCLEGYTYWQYGFGFYTYFADLLKSRTKGAIDLFANEKIHQIALFQQSSFIHENIAVNFSDTFSNVYTFIGLSHYLKGLFPDCHVPPEVTRGKYTDDHCSRWAPAIRNFVWFNDSYKGTHWPDETIYFPSSQWFISRHTTEVGHFAFTTKGGNNGEPHNHNDVGHFMLYKNGEAYLCDIGSGLYNRDYFGDKRYTFLCNGSRGHSVPIINGQFQSEGIHHKGIVERVSCGDNGKDSIHINMTQTYEVENLQRLLRQFTWEKSSNPSLTLTDTYRFSSQPHSVVERFISPMKQIEKTNHGIVIHGIEGALYVIYDHKKIETSWNEVEYKNHFGESAEVTIIDMQLKEQDTDINITIQFYFTGC
ncbi:hypothetical protein J2S74_004802 [Evansella vedderi]|uniref:Heparinase II/III-like C-terminal domain-containing protein n=1 Tax=Evansella vedderi TaxID=38282 RepID=A0ABU0A1I1_9BACI|nr:heparinase II/III family protein [Evansella vedderi]MDQ0257344.1 hypothetical protein [Evansella vedderi]